MPTGSLHANIILDGDVKIQFEDSKAMAGQVDGSLLTDEKCRLGP